VDERDKYIGVNTDTFFPALIRRSTVEPELDDEDWDLLLNERLTSRQFDDLANAAGSLNRRGVDVAFSLAASRILFAEHAKRLRSGSATRQGGWTAGRRPRRPYTSTTSGGASSAR